MASKDKIFLDTNVALDHLANRHPFAEYAHRIFALAEIGELQALVSPLTFSDLYYILRKLKGHVEAVRLLKELIRLVAVASVGTEQVKSALASDFGDFEDAVQYFTAKAYPEITALLTRDQGDFGASKLPVLTPQEYLAARESGGGGMVF